MARGGYRPGAGRPRKGEEERSRKPETQAVEDEPSGVLVNPTDTRTPLEFMLAVMNDPSQTAQRRDRMAIAAAPFVHARAGEAGKKESKAEAAKKAETGKFAPASAPRLVVDNTKAS